MLAGTTYLSKKQNLGFGNQVKCLKKELCLQNHYKLVYTVADEFQNPREYLLKDVKYHRILLF